MGDSERSGFSSSEAGSGFGESPRDRGASGSESSDDKSPRVSSRSRSPHRPPAQQHSLPESAEPPRHQEWDLVPPVAEGRQFGWLQTISRLLLPWRTHMFTNYWLLRPLTHDAILCGNLTELQSFKASSNFPHYARLRIWYGFLILTHHLTGGPSHLVLVRISHQMTLSSLACLSHACCECCRPWASHTRP